MRKNKKLVSGVIAGVSAISLMLGGTLAYLSAGNALNKFENKAETPTDQGLLHDDFEADINKDVYVENIGEEPIAVRIKLEEYYKLAGEEIVGKQDGLTEALYEWVTHKCIDNNCDSGSHGDWTWTMGGQKYYERGVRDNEAVAGGQEQDGKETVITKEMYEADQKKYGQTLPGNIIKAADYTEGFVGWILCEDGYFYWSQPLQPGEATGMLLDNVVPREGLKELDYTYYINVLFESVNKNDLPMWTEPNKDQSKNPGKGKESVVENPDGTRDLTEEASNDAKDVLKDIFETNGGEDPKPDEKATGIRIPEGSNATIKAKETKNAPEVIFEPVGSSAEVTWTSSNPGAVTVDASTGVVTGVASGSATITATITKPDGSKATATYEVTVETEKEPDPEYPTGISIPADSDVTLDMGGQKTSNAPVVTFEPVGRTAEVEWSTSVLQPTGGSADSVITVDTNGKVTAVGAGVAKVTGTIKDNTGKVIDTVEYEVTVKPELVLKDYTDAEVYLQVRYACTPDYITDPSEKAIGYYFVSDDVERINEFIQQWNGVNGERASYGYSKLSNFVDSTDFDVSDGNGYSFHVNDPNVYIGKYYDFDLRDNTEELAVVGTRLWSYEELAAGGGLGDQYVPVTVVKYENGVASESQTITFYMEAYGAFNW